MIEPYSNGNTGVERWTIRHDGGSVYTYTVKFIPEGNGGTQFAVSEDDRTKMTSYINFNGTKFYRAGDQSSPEPAAVYLPKDQSQDSWSQMCSFTDITDTPNPSEYLHKLQESLKKSEPEAALGIDSKFRIDYVLYVNNHQTVEYNLLEVFGTQNPSHVYLFRYAQRFDVSTGAKTKKFPAKLQKLRDKVVPFLEKYDYKIYEVPLP